MALLWHFYGTSMYRYYKIKSMLCLRAVNVVSDGSKVDSDATGKSEGARRTKDTYVLPSNRLFRGVGRLF